MVVSDAEVARYRNRGIEGYPMALSEDGGVFAMGAVDGTLNITPIARTNTELSQFVRNHLLRQSPADCHCVPCPVLATTTPFTLLPTPARPSSTVCYSVPCHNQPLFTTFQISDCCSRQKDLSVRCFRPALRSPWRLLPLPPPREIACTNSLIFSS